ncbi:MAG: PxKF domain-containing protein, partial [Nocardioides sp.]
CVDNAGNTASDTVTDIDIDKTKPVVSDDVSITGTKGNSDWYTSDVGVTFTGTDALSGPPTATQKVTSNGQGTAVRVQSPAFTDNAGNSSDVGTVTKFFQIDKEAPTVGNAVLVTGTMGDNDWYKSDVTVSFTATDNVSGVVGDRTRNVTSSQQGTGIVLESPAFSDVAGNTRAAGSRSFTVKVDSLAPSVSLLSGPTAGSSYFFGSVPAAPTCGANDATPGSGLADADGAATGQQDCVVKGYGTSVGPHTVTATATDNAGNTTTVSRTYTVGAWTTKGFYSPVDMGGVYNTVKGGSTVPLKFELFAGATELTDVAAVDTFTTSKITCGTDVVTDTVEITSTGGTSLRYDATGGQFIQNWKTPATVGACYKTTMTAADGSKISALFKIK